MCAAMKTFLTWAVLALTIVTSDYRIALAQSPTKAELKVGFVPGPYIDEFKVGVEPELKKKGYSVRYFEFSTGLEANTAVFRNDIDANVMQHTVFLNSYNDRQKTDLAGIVHVPTASNGAIFKKAPRRHQREARHDRRGAE